jgi:hypothetical protein
MKCEDCDLHSCMYVCMYKGGPKIGPNTATYNDLLIFTVTAMKISNLMPYVYFIVPRLG